MYIDYDYYLNQYKGVPMSLEEFERLSLRACQMAEIATGGRISTAAFPGFAEFQKEQIKRACAVQTEYLKENGGTEFLSGGGSYESVKIGSFSVGGKKNMELMSPLFEGYLATTGLLYKGANICT